MSKKLPFEEIFKQKINELPLPHEDKAWQKMKQLLDEKKERKPFVVFPKEKMIGGALLLLLLCFWLMISPEQRRKQTSAADANHSVNKTTTVHQKMEKKITKNQQFTERTKDKHEDEPAGFSSSKKKQANPKIAFYQKKNFGAKNKQNDTLNKEIVSGRKQADITASKEKILLTESKSQKDIHTANFYNSKTISNGIITHQPDSNLVQDSSERLAGIDKRDNLFSLQKRDSSFTSSLIKDSLQQSANNNKTTASSTKSAVTIKKYKTYLISAGIEVKQQMPINGQKIIAYNYNGNSTLLTDYIPAGYIQFEKKNRWFLQAGFSYAAPRFVKEFSYWQQTKADYAHGSVTVTSNHLQKTFYNQLPLSFNFYVHPAWSVGASVMYNWLRGAVAVQKTATGNVPLNMPTISEEQLPIKGFTDSFLYKTTASVLLQTTYEKNRWLFGLRYLQDVQPFIAYTLPNGEKNNKKNSSVEMLIQYRLFRSSKFNAKRTKQP